MNAPDDLLDINCGKLFTRPTRRRREGATQD
jgi:hypothetical protein